MTDRENVVTSPLIIREEMPARAKGILEYIAEKLFKADGSPKKWTLDEAKAMLESIGGAATSAIGLGAIVAQIAEMVVAVFGG